MSIPMYIPAPSYVRRLPLKRPMTLDMLCQRVGIECRASGLWTKRQVEIVHGDTLEIMAEPGDWGAVQIRTPERDAKRKARLALAVLAYGLHDLAARQSVIASRCFQLRPPRGRPRKARALSVRERQRRFREKNRKKQPVPKNFSGLNKKRLG